MESEREENADTLTTDACPSPPRECPESVNSSVNNETKEEPKSYSIYNKKKKPKSKSNPKQAIANVINISNSKSIQVGSNIIINVGKREKNVENADEEKNEIVKTEAICQLLKRTDRITTDTLLFVREHIGKHWQVAMIKLGYSDGKIHQYYEQHHLVGVGEVVYKMLLHWMQDKPAEATVGYLFTILWNSQEKDVVKRMAEHIATK